MTSLVFVICGRFFLIPLLNYLTLVFGLLFLLDNELYLSKLLLSARRDWLSYSDSFNLSELSIIWTFFSFFVSSIDLQVVCIWGWSSSWPFSSKWMSIKFVYFWFSYFMKLFSSKFSNKVCQLSSSFSLTGYLTPYSWWLLL